MTDSAVNLTPADYQGDEPFAFVSYAHADSSMALTEIEALSQRNINIYFDDDIEPGSRWHDELAQAIVNCDVFVLMVTRHSVNSPHCQREIAFAVDEGKPILAVHFEDVVLPAGIRLAIGNRQAIVRSQFSEVEFHDRLEAALIRYLGHTDEHASVAADSTHGRYALLAGTLMVFLLMVSAVAYYSFYDEVPADAVDDLLIEARGFAELDQYGQAFSILQPLMNAGIVDDELSELWQSVVNPMIPIVNESAASVYFKPYEQTTDDWVFAGITPIETAVDAPRGVLLFRIEKTGFREGLFVVANPGPSLRTTDPIGKLKETSGTAASPLTLIREGVIGDDFAFVPESNGPAFLLGWSRNLFGQRRHIPAFAIGRKEITNQEFKEFVDAGGYENDAYWEGLDYRTGGGLLTETEARSRFVDLTERPGPAGWEFSSYATGDALLPVSGVSWYEAAAYARYRGLTLPTVHHWARAAHAPFEAMFSTAPAISNQSNFTSQGPRQANDRLGLGPWGTVDTAGNVREWVWNPTGDKALALGGSWKDYSSTYLYAYTVDPMNRSTEHGIRLMQRLGDEPLDPELLAPVSLAFDDSYTPRDPVSDEAFEAFRFQFTASSRTPVEVVVTELEATDSWVAQSVELRFSDSESFELVVVRPAERRAKLQPIVYAPPGDVFMMSRPNRDAISHMRNVEYLVKGGRAVVMPIWAGAYERFQSRSREPAVNFTRQNRTAFYWHQDIVTTLDYIESQDDLDSGKVGILGISYGTNFIVPIVLAIEGRLKAAALIAGGISFSTNISPMIDSVNYLPHVTQPVLMVNGRYDHIYPYEQSQKRFFDLLGTHGSEKKHIVYDVGHFAFPGNVLARDVNDWFDQTLGTVW